MGIVTPSNFDEENERFVVFAERWLDKQFEWAASQKRLHADDGPGAAGPIPPRSVSWTLSTISSTPWP